MQPKEEGKKTLLTCSSCGYSRVEKEDILMKETVRGKKKLEVTEDKSRQAMPKMQTECPKCAAKEAYYWTQQTRASDEPETQFFECVKCKNRWRTYG